MTALGWGLALVVFTSGMALGQQNVVSGTMSRDGSSLCLAASGGIGNGTGLVVNDCIAGHWSQMFQMGSDGHLHISADQTMCVEPATSVQNFSNLILHTCGGQPPVTFDSAGRYVFQDHAATPFCLSVTAGSNPPGTPVMLANCSNANFNARWSGTIQARWTSLNVNPRALFDSNGCLIDHQGTPMSALGCRLVAVRAGEAYGVNGSTVIAGGKAVTILGNGGKIVSQGGGNIVSQGGGNIVSQGGGNLQIVKPDGTPIVDSLISPNGSNLVSTDSGGLVAPGPAYLVAAGAGNVQNTSPYKLESFADAISYAIRRSDTSAVGGFLGSVAQLIQSGGLDSYQITSVSSVAVWPAQGSVRVSWGHTGTAVAPHTISLWLLLPTSQYHQLTPSPISVAPQDPGSVTLNTNLAPNTQGALCAKDEKTSRFTCGNQVSVQATSAYSLTGVSVNPATWYAGAVYRITWTGTGAASSNETVTMSLAGTRLATQPAQQGYFDYTVGYGMVGIAGVLTATDDLTNKTVSGPSVSVQAPPDSYQITSVSSPATWPAPGPVSVSWGHSGTASAPHSISFWLHLANGQYLQVSPNALSIAPQDPGSVTLNTNLAPGTQGTVCARDEKSLKMTCGNPVQVQAPSPFNLTGVAVNPTTWSAGATYRITWTGTGSPSQNETVSLYMGGVRLASVQPAQRGYFDFQVGYGLKGQSGSLTVIDELTNRSVAGPVVKVQ